MRTLITLAINVVFCCIWLVLLSRAIHTISPEDAAIRNLPVGSLPYCSVYDPVAKEDTGLLMPIAEYRQLHPGWACLEPLCLSGN
jgi:hypothetical protein